MEKSFLELFSRLQTRDINDMSPNVFTFVVKQEVPNDEDVEWLYTSCLFYEKSFLELFARLQTRDISDMSSNPFT